MTLEDISRRAMETANDIIEQAAREADQGGTCGVKVTWPACSWLPIAVVDPSIPYGEIHEFRER